jgi:hypothetical protein
LHRYRRFKKTRTQERADRIEVLADHLAHIPHPIGFDTYIFPKQIFEHRRVKSRYVFVSGKEVREAEPSDDGAGYGADSA